jgi:hypothetical protein
MLATVPAIRDDWSVQPEPLKPVPFQSAFLRGLFLPSNRKAARRGGFFPFSGQGQSPESDGSGGGTGQAKPRKGKRP